MMDHLAITSACSARRGRDGSGTDGSANTEIISEGGREEHTRTRFRAVDSVTVALIMMVTLVLGPFTGCADPVGSGSGPDDHSESTGSIAVSIGNALTGSSTIEPDLDMTVSEYLVTISGPGDTVDSTIAGSETTATIDSLLPGSWSITVNALNGDDPAVIIATGTATATVVAGTVAEALVTVRPVEGEGTLTMSLHWPELPGGVLTFSSTLTPDGESSSILEFTVTSSGEIHTAAYTGSHPAGYYTLWMQLEDNDGTPVWTDIWAVRIIEQQSSSRVIELDAADITNEGAIAVSIDTDLQNPLSLSLNGLVPELSPGRNITVNLDPIEPPVSYQWYIGGLLQVDETSGSIVIGPAGVELAEGSHRLTAIVRKGGSVSSIGATLRVLAPGAYAIGDVGPAGGWIFYIDEENEHNWTYLEVAPVETEWEDKQWGTRGHITEVNASAVGTGGNNTALLVAWLQSNEDDTRGDVTHREQRAAWLCATLEYNEYGDWFLPSRNELQEIWWNLVSDQDPEKNSGRGAPHDGSIAGFAAENYWSSTERSGTFQDNRAWRQSFGNGFQTSNFYKTDGLRVRAIRAF